MHPGFYGWWRGRHGACHGHAQAQCGEGAASGWHGGWHGPPFGAWANPSFEDGGVLGVRRPLRFLAYKLDLSEAQVGAFAAILDQLKTERAQAAVDQRRRISGLAEALESTNFDEGRLADVGEEQRKTEERVRAAVAQALRQMHAALDDDQRKRLAYLLRTGALTL